MNTLPENATSSNQFCEVPEELKSLPRWVTWKLEQRNGRPTKPPYQVSGKKADVKKPTHWSSFNAALSVSENIGFVLGAGFVGVDLDSCVDSDGKLEPGARAIVDALDSYTELSPSGRGVHILCRGELPPGGRRKGKIEIYDSDRYFTITGNRISGHGIEERTKELKALHARTFAKVETGKKTAKPLPGPKNAVFTPTDENVIEVLSRSKSQGEKFQRLRQGDINGYSSQSEADLALCRLLAFYTQDEPQIERIIKSTALFDDKWARANYSQRTIRKAVESATEFYDWNRHKGALPEKSSHRVTGMNVSELLSTDFPETTFALPLYFPAGLTILASKPKIGKSWLVLGAGLAISSGQSFLGEKPLCGDVLYLALEDNLKRMKSRLKMLGAKPTERMQIETAWPKADQGGIEKIREWLDTKQGQARLVVIDTLAKFKPKDSGGRNKYDADSDALAPIHDLARDYDICVLVVHHLRKQPGEDYVDEISGSLGISGVADTVHVLKRERGQASAFLRGTGRDIDEVELALAFDKTSGNWTAHSLQGEFVRATNRQQSIVEVLQKHPGKGLKMSQIADRLGLNRNNLSAILKRMKEAGLVEQVRGGSEYKLIGVVANTVDDEVSEQSE